MPISHSFWFNGFGYICNVKSWAEALPGLQPFISTYLLLWLGRCVLFITCCLPGLWLLTSFPVMLSSWLMLIFCHYNCSATCFVLSSFLIYFVSQTPKHLLPFLFPFPFPLVFWFSAWWYSFSNGPCRAQMSATGIPPHLPILCTCKCYLQPLPITILRNPVPLLISYKGKFVWERLLHLQSSDDVFLLCSFSI